MNFTEKDLRVKYKSETALSPADDGEIYLMSNYLNNDIKYTKEYTKWLEEKVVELMKEKR